MLGAMYFTSHARTSHFEIFPRTHFARTCAFCLIFVRTRTRTSKVHIYNFLPFFPQATNLDFFLKRRNNFGFFFYFRETWDFFSDKKIQFWIFFKETCRIFCKIFKCNCIAPAPCKYPTRTHFARTILGGLRTPFAPKLPHAHVRSHFRTHAH